MPLRKLHQDIEALDALCAGVLHNPQDKELAGKLVSELAAEADAANDVRQQRSTPPTTRS